MINGTSKGRDGSTVGPRHGSFYMVTLTQLLAELLSQACVCLEEGGNRCGSHVGGEPTGQGPVPITLFLCWVTLEVLLNY